MLTLTDDLLSPETLAAVAERARSSARTVESERRITPELADSLSDSGFARHFVPHQYGGTAGTFVAALEAVAHIGETCASTAWCAALYAAHGRLAAYLPDQAQQELWGAGADVRIAAAVNPPAGNAIAEPGGWRLNGRWSFASGIDHAHWVLLASWTTHEDTRTHRIFAVPRSACQIIDTWNTLGLKGTGSNTVLAHDVLVPEHRTFTLGDLARSRADAARCHTVPYPMVAGLQFAAPALGTARGALDAWTRTMAGRTKADGRPARDSTSVQQVLARASAEIQAAGLLLGQAARRADNGEITPLTVAENVRDAAAAVDLCTTAVGQLMRTSGARALAEHDPVQQRWRDVHAVASHAALDPESAAALYARAALPAPEAAR